MSQRQWNLIEDAVRRQEAGLCWAGLGWAGLGWAERHKHQIKTFVFVGENEESFHWKQLNWGPGMN